MAGLQLNHIYKVYPNGAKAVNDFTMSIEDKEFIVFVGPSGCGKSTTLRMIAGLEEITAGELRIDDAVVNDVEPKDRDIAMVFQNYALYPHMTVYENMSFSLRLSRFPDVKKDKEGNPVLDKNGKEITVMRKYTKKEIDDKVQEAARILGITEYLNRKPKEMSGGQRQRVALGRAIVRKPKVMLLDEPLSNLDAKLRTAMRSEISKLHHKLQTTFIYVTHDQVEAMTMGTRIVVMKDGCIQQIDSPRNLYNYPCNKFVAGFIGTPQMNFFAGTLTKNGDKVTVAFDDTGVKLEASPSVFNKTNPEYLNGKKIIFGIRAEHVSVDSKQYPYKAKCRVSHSEELGTECLVYADFNTESTDNVTESPTRVIIKAPAGSLYQVDEEIEVSLDLTHMHLFDAETEETVSPRVPQQVVAEGNVVGDKLCVLGTEIALPQAMRVAEGSYEVTVPTAAVKLGGKIAAKVVEVEEVNDKQLVHLQVGNAVLFALANKEEQIGKTAKISIDLKLISLSQNGETAVAALNCENSLTGNLTKRKIVAEKDINGKIKKVSDFAFDFEIADASFNCSRALAMRLVNGGGQEIFSKELEFKFSPYDVAVAEQGVEATVEKVVDYGDETFAVCKVGDETVNISVEKGFAEPRLCFTLNPEQLTVVDKVRNMRLV